MWFDAGELTEVLRFVEKGGLERARERDLEELAERERRLRVEEAIAEAGSGFVVAPDDAGPAWNGSARIFADLIQSITTAWRAR